MSRAANTAPAYIEFAAQSNFSFLRGASDPRELALAACLAGHRAATLADRNTVAGVVRAWTQCRSMKRAGNEPPFVFPYHPGCRLVFSDGADDILSFPRDREGWGRLCRMLTVANMRGGKGAPDLLLDDLLEWGDGLSLALLPARLDDPGKVLSRLVMLRARFGTAVRLAAAPRYMGDDRAALDIAAQVASRAGTPLMAVNDVLYHTPQRRPVQDTITAIRLNTTVAEAGLALEANAERHLKTAAEMARLFRRHPDAIAETVRFARELHFSLGELSHNYPEETSSEGMDPQDELEMLTREGAGRRYPGGVPDHVQTMIAHELDIVSQQKYARYFLTVHDIVRHARSIGILCQGRGSAANSVICYCLGITEVAPELTDLLFERFVSTERDEPPDIDVDFEHERRHEVIAYIYAKYSEKRTALAASVVTFRSRSALREVAKVMGMSKDVQDALASSVWGWSSDVGPDNALAAAGLDIADPATRLLVAHAQEIVGFPRHLSQHVGGFVITRDRLDEIVPIVRTGMDEREMVEWDKDDLDAVGILKVDVLALGMLSCLRRCFDLLDTHYGETPTMATLPQDSRVYDMICRADTLGVFQIESRAQMSMLPRLRPRIFYDLVIEVAIVRPGPIQGDMVHPYLRRREKKEKEDYPSPALEKILSRTLGVPLFQEQAMKIAIDAGGFTPGEADQLRRAMATFKRNGTIGDYRRKLIEGMVGRGYDPGFAERCFRQIEGFANYGFPESHAASFALLVYVSAWFKAFYPDVFCAAILNAQPMGFYAPAQLVRDAREHGVEVRPADVNLSQWDCTLEPDGFEPARIAARHSSMSDVILSRNSVRLGLRQVKGLREADAIRLVAARGDGYASIRDLWLRSGLDVGVLERLADADAFRSISLDRREALWAVKALDRAGATESLPLFDRPSQPVRDLEPAVRLPVMPQSEHVIHDYRALGLSLKAHPVSFLRRRLDDARISSCASLTRTAHGRHATVAGLVLVRQMPGSAKGVVFMTIEDETGIANIIVWKKTFQRFRSVVMGARLVRVTGRVQSQSDVIHVVAETIEDMNHWLSDLSEQAGSVTYLSPPDEIRRPPADRKPPKGDDEVEQSIRLKRVLRQTDRLRNEDGNDNVLAMPPGRNFH